MKPKTPKRAAAAEQAPATKSPVRRSRAKATEPPSTADDRSAAPAPAPASEDTAAAPPLTATIAEQITVAATQSGSTSTEEIARRAFELYLEDGQVHGRDIEHWLAAERALKNPTR